MTRFGVLLLALLLVLATNPAGAQDSIQNVAFFYPLRTRRPVIERELEVRVAHAKGRDGRTTEAAAALELPILPRRRWAGGSASGSRHCWSWSPSRARARRRTTSWVTVRASASCPASTRGCCHARRSASGWSCR